MAAISNSRAAALRQAILRRKPWEVSTGARTTRGKWRSSTNATTHGADSLAFALVVRYIETMGKALQRGEYQLNAATPPIFAALRRV